MDGWQTGAGRKLEFEHRGVYRAEIGSEGRIQETEIDSRRPEEIERENRLKNLPEFARGVAATGGAAAAALAQPGRQLLPEKESDLSPEATGNVIDPDDYEFLQTLQQKRRAAEAAQRAEDEAELRIFKARSALRRMEIAATAAADDFSGEESS